MARIFLLFALLAGAVAGPLSTKPLKACSSHCSATPLQKYQYEPSTTYVYKYEGSSFVSLNSTSQAESELKWTAQVELAFITPCDAAVQIVSQRFEGEQETREFEKELTKYPIVVAMSDGVVTSVCAHPKDLPASLNLKKGIISKIQNTLPSLSKIHSGKTFVETDVAGRCPTKYDVEPLSKSSFKIVKTKEHKSCEESVSSQGESPFASFIMKLPLPLESSNSTCTQKIDQGIVKEVECKDVNILKPVLGSKKFLKAVQKSKLVLLEKRKGAQVSGMESVRYTNLTSEVLLEPKTEKVLPEVEKLLSELGSEIQHSVKKDSARLLAKLIGLLYRVPEDEVKPLLNKIRRGNYSSQPKRLEEIFLDAIAFTNNAGSVKVMVDEILNSNEITGRTPLYVIALHLMKRPCLKTVSALIPLLTSQKTPTPLVLAAGSVVGKYMRQHPHAQQESEIHRFMKEMENKLERSFSSASSSYERKVEALAALKSIGNMANMTHSLEELVLRVAESKSAPIPVRIAATQSFEKCNCTEKMSKSLIQQAMETSEQTEVRIASYLAAIRCASYEEASRLVHQIREEANSQVRSFILSHLRNYQSSDAPYLQNQRLNLTAFAIPSSYEQDVRRFSRNIDLSYYLPSFGLGAGLDTNVIFAPGKYLPRQLQANITLDLLRNVINVGEFGIRVEDFEDLIEMFVGPEGYLQKTPMQKIVEDISMLLSDKGSRIKKHLQETIKNIEQPQAPSMEHNGKWFRGREQESGPTVDTFTRIFGREILFLSAKMGRPTESLIDEIIDEIAKVSQSIIFHILKLDINAVRAIQMNNEVFIPTVQGIPLQLKYVATAVAGLKAKTDSSLLKTKVEVVPELSVHLNGFAGYSMGAKAGLRQDTTIYSSSAIELDLDFNQKVIVKLDVPRKSEPLYLKSDVYMMKKLPGQKDQKLSPSSYPKYKRSSCIEKIEKTLGLKTCYEVEAPKYQESNAFPLGAVKVSLTAEKLKQDKSLIQTQSSFSLEERSLDLVVEAPGARVQKKMEMEVQYKLQKTMQSAVVYVEIPEADVKRAVKAEIDQISVGSALKVDLNIYSSKSKRFMSADKVVEIIFGVGRNSETVNSHLLLKTMKPLTKYISADIEVDASVKLNPRVQAVPEEYRQYLRYLPRSVDLKKFEVELTLLEKFKTLSHIRKTREQESAKYEASFYSAIDQLVLSDIKGEGKIKGHLEDLNLESSMELKGRVGQYKYEADAELVVSERQNKSMIFIRKESGQKLILVESDVQQKSPHMKTIEAKIEIPRLMPKYSVSGHLKEQNHQTSRLSVEIKKNERTIMEVQGPMTLVMSQEKFLQQSVFDVKNLISREQYEQATKVLLSPEEKELLFSIKKESQEIAKTHLFFEKKSEQTFLASGELVIEKLVQSSSQFQRRSSEYELSMNTIVQPRSQSARRYESRYFLNTAQKKVEVDMSLDADRDQSKTFSIRADYDVSIPERTASIDSRVSYKNQEYKLKLETVLDALRSHTPEASRNKLHIQVVDPRSKQYRFAIEKVTSQESRSKSRIEVRSELELAGKQYYKVETNYDFEYRRTPLFVASKGQAKVKVATQPEYTISGKAGISEQDKSIDLTIKAEEPSMRKPMKLEFQSQKTSQQASTKVELDLEPLVAVRLSTDGKVSMDEETQYPKDIEIKSEMKLPETQEYDLSIKSSYSRPIEVELRKGSSEILKVNYVSSRTGEWKIRASVPSRQMELQSRRSNEETAITYTPDLSRRDHRYEASVSHSRKQLFTSGESIESLIRLRYPGRQNHIKIFSQVDRQAEKSQGVVELDIFESSKDKVVIDVRTAHQSRNSELVAELRVPRLNLTPKLICAISLTPEVKRADLAILKNREDKRPAVDMSVVYNTPTEKNANIYVLLRTPKEKYEATAVVQPQDLFRCRGKSVNGTIHAPSVGSVQFVSAFCAPAYIEFGITPSSRSDMYIAKIGMNSPASIKLAIDRVFNSSRAITYSNVNSIELTYNKYGRPSWIPKQPVALIGAKLFTPMMVSFGSKLNATAVQEYVQASLRAAEIASRVAKDLKRSAVEEIKETFRGKASLKLSQELEQLYEQVAKQAEELTRDIKEQLPTQEQMRKLKERVERKYQEVERSIRRAIESGKKIVKSLTGMSVEQLEEKLEKMESTLREELYAARQMVLNILKNIRYEGIESLKQVEIPVLLRQALEKSSIWDWVVNSVNKLVENFKNDIDSFKNWVKSFWTSLGDDIERVIQQFMTFSPFKKVVDWIISWFQPSSDSGNRWLSVEYTKPQMTIVGAIAKALGIYVSPKVAYLSVQVPLQRPVSSLRAAAISVGLPRQLYRLPTGVHSPSGFLSNLMSAYSRPAIITNRDIETFDGLVIPVVPSNCQIQLVKTPRGAEVYWEQTSQQKKYITIEDPQDQKLRFTLEEGKPISSPSMASSEYRSQEMSAIRISPRKIIVSLKEIQINLEDNEIEVIPSKWTFGKMQGLLGDHNSEMANEVRRESDVEYNRIPGRHSLSKTGVRELYNQYKKQPACRIPRE